MTLMCVCRLILGSYVRVSLDSGGENMFYSDIIHETMQIGVPYCTKLQNGLFLALSDKWKIHFIFCASSGRLKM